MKSKYIKTAKIAVAMISIGTTLGTGLALLSTLRQPFVDGKHYCPAWEEQKGSLLQKYDEQYILVIGSYNWRGGVDYADTRVDRETWERAAILGRRTMH